MAFWKGFIIFIFEKQNPWTPYSTLKVSAKKTKNCHRIQLQLEFDVLTESLAVDLLWAAYFQAIAISGVQLPPKKWKLSLLGWISIDSLIPGSFLVGGFNPFDKYESQWESSPNRGENNKIVETTTQIFNDLV